MGHFWDTSRLLPKLGSRGLSFIIGRKYEPCVPPAVAHDSSLSRAAAP